MSEIAVQKQIFPSPLAAERRDSARRHIARPLQLPSATAPGISEASCCVPEQATPGLVALPTGRLVWWTGRVAIGLRYQPLARSVDTEVSQSAEWIQSLLLH
ncbi:hypothetical protein LRH25_03485 [Ideonella azotifigens]|uniref:Uncharacterized protein n=1 Tax=Ideonella azotifigens TaxID=513160 RepID=A0ABN1KJF9_9BURK|nr:hypothetical protein [Ideonella azotifigens]MCD2339398.1 hypothetical protein [Ideonella azotifigens]